ncbi:hypothetical protein [Acinetobacter sp. WCHAc010052]|uniref:hypothetical protein n=1 Tax=Acinetobacter sp. WCHAc010052 TaxID=2004647 RepID=UPI000B3D43C9|nr:hypothetical protein [Acinetobacter sp. WCHAc010052]AXY60205.1 hypothetical protein CDG61_09300 [Acinetobacter sp. WCHAc010052]
MGLGVALASMGSAIFADGTEKAIKSLDALNNVMRLITPPHHNSKPNRVSQAKRRKYKRQSRV